MRLCPFCGHDNREGVLFCEECGQALFGDGTDAMSTKQLQNVPDELGLKATWGTARFKTDASIILHIRDASEPITVVLENEETYFGRHDPAAERDVEVDLTPYGALEKGVSRRHAALKRAEDTLTLVDLGSVNGTYLNGQLLLPNQPRIIRDGDEVRLGKLVLHVYFKS